MESCDILVVNLFFLGRYYYYYYYYYHYYYYYYISLTWQIVLDMVLNIKQTLK